MAKEVKLQRRCNQNRKRSQRRAIYCPIHGCYIHSVSQKYSLFADSPGQLQERGISQKKARMLVAAKTTISLQGEWLEAFWCDQCQKTQWYCVKVGDRQNSSNKCNYEILLASPQLWQQAGGVIHTEGNPSVSEFTRRNAKMLTYKGSKDFPYLG